MNVTVKKLTDITLLQRANTFTTGHHSNMTLAMAYAFGHSNIRTQLFWVECTDIPLFVASQLVRSHVGVQYFQRSKRTDRGGEDFSIECRDIANRIDIANEMSDSEQKTDLLTDLEGAVRGLAKRFDRYTPTDLAFIINAEALINMAHKRLCGKASAETRDLMTQINLAVSSVDPDLGEHLVPQCIFRGGYCPEPRSCGWMLSEVGDTVADLYFDTMRKARAEYQKLRKAKKSKTNQ